MDLEHHLKFYRQIKTFKDFSNITDSSYYHSVPQDWSIVFTDIKDSTQAINDGRHKEVNLIGAASISVYVNLIGNNDVPYVFGGDGATLIAPATILNDLIPELLKLKILAKTKFNLELRVGHIKISKLKKLGQDLQIGKYELSPGNNLAQFKGGVLTLGEKLFKSGDPSITIENQFPNKVKLNLKGLSCRMNPLKSVNGKILTLLCKPNLTSNSAAIIEDLLKKITYILNNDLRSATPVRSENMKWPLPPHRPDYESRTNPETPLFMLNIIFSFFYALISNLSLIFGFKLGNFIPTKYKEELKFNSDFKKFDDTLRMVLDCTKFQIVEIQNLLEDFHIKELITYGFHISDEALMTCVVLSPISNKHIHFIDGANGGYTIAAIQMKNQQKNLKKVG